MEALIVVDVQNDFLPGGALAVPEGDRVVPVINRLQHAFDLVVATRDWHPPDHGSFATAHPGRKPGDVIDLYGVQQVLWPPHCVQHTQGADFAPGLETERIAAVFYKGVDPKVDSYSTFFDNAHRRSTGLAEWLRERGVDEVHLAGLATDYCVHASGLHARELGFRCSVVLDGCRGIELHPGDVARSLAELEQAGVLLVRSDELLSRRGEEAR